MKKYVVEEKPLQAILDYLATKPFKEVAVLITNIQSATKPFDEKLKWTEEEFTVSCKSQYDAGYSVGYKDGKNGNKPEENRILELEKISNV